MTPSSQRRRVGAPSDLQPHHVAISTPDQNQNPDRNQSDLISRLPDNLLSSILLYLPIQDAIRTSILSSRWRHVWKQNPLHLDCYSIKSYFVENNKIDQANNKSVQAAACVASTHPGPIHSFSISHFGVPPSEIDALIEILTRKGIRKLDLRFMYDDLHRYRIPLCLLQCQSLRKVSLSACFFRPSPILNSSFPNLRKLTLEFVFMWDDLLRCLLKSCTQLEVLHLANFTGLQHVHINAGKLQALSLMTRFSPEFVKHIAIEDAPQLRLLMIGPKIINQKRISLQNVQKLEMLGFLSTNATLKIGGTFSKPYNRYEMCVNQSMKLPNVKKLAILVGFDSELECSFLAALLRSLPCLEYLVIKCIKSMGPAPEVGFWEGQTPFGCLEHHLKHFGIINSLSSRAEREFVKYLRKHGVVLEESPSVWEWLPLVLCS